MKFLLTNDDGVHAPGLAALARAASELGEVVVVAPHEHVSGCSHQVTTHRPLELSQVAERWHMLDGSPVDCARVGLLEIAGDVDWLLSGINQGGNLGADVYLSGTVAAAREACLLGRRAIAFSQYHKLDEIDWRQAADWTAAIVRELTAQPLQRGCFWSVNLPPLPTGWAMPEWVYCHLDPHPLPVRYERLDGKFHYRGNYHERLRDAGCDVDVCFNGRIAITKLTLSPPMRDAVVY